ncbi:hypothetical protein SCLCIDRAFT_1224802 [Scleroderma citrinum Foug A]|uniref:Uncharacterized protein n=1 Tax=Scleroderma citrinum Foug A TaxID=1036808 RepID=A0A0C2ZDZ3_9AGAM|nr:hypothetical protein SCLCIDRAFT_1224802 [Scleroderma citrinum Foug A]
MSLSTSFSNSTTRTQTLVVPSPTSLSCTFQMLTRILTAASWSWIDLRMVAPSLVALKSPADVDWDIFGPRVDLTRSLMASAPGKGEQRVLCTGVSL